VKKSRSISAMKGAGSVMVREKEEAAQTMAEERLPKEPECVSNSSEAQR
jgi:hypothetical protein